MFKSHKLRNFKITVYKKDNVDILILDKHTSQFAKYCIPKNKTFIEVGIRKEIPIILSFRFIINLILNLIRTRKITLSFILSLILIKKAKVIVTFTDNIALMGHISKFCSNRLIISIQNGTRSKHNHHGWNNISYFPVLYGCGIYEKSLLDEMGAKTQEYIPSGSLKYGIYKKYFEEENYIGEKYITFISTWRNNGDKSYMKPIYRSHERMIPKIYEICLKNKYAFQILTASQKQDLYEENEINYFLKLNNFNDLNFVEKKEFSDSYKYCENSKLLISYTSALAFEMYGLGIKTLFLGSIKNISENKNYPWSEIFNFLPNLVKLTDDSDYDIENKISKIISMDSSEYLEITQKSREYFMSYKEKYTHELIHDRIVKKLN